MYFMIAANTQRPNISHVIHDMHLIAGKKIAIMFRRPSALFTARTVLHGGGHNCICKCVQANTIALCSSVRVDTIANAKPSGGHYCICNNVPRIVLHRGQNCMRHRCGWRFCPPIWQTVYKIPLIAPSFETSSFSLC